MTRKYWQSLIPDLLLGAGIILSTLISTLTMHSSWLVMAGPVLLSLSLLCADVLNGRLQGKFPRPSAPALIMASSLLLAALIVTTRHPHFVAALISIIGASSWVILKSGLDGRANACRT
ncbi:MAG: hypothetical protein ABIP02_07480 [Arenimonas sp.]